MSVLRQLNVLGQMRVDVPHIRSVESSIAADFDVVVGRGLAGDRALVVRGFTLSNVAVGTNSSDIQLLTADGIIYNVNASESGSFLWIPPDRAGEQLSSANGKVSGSFTASAVNYVGVDFKRSSDATTTDLVQFLDANTEKENGRNIPLGRTLDYVIIISSAPFSTSPNVTPIAKVTTDSNNKVASVQDARQMIYRLGSGGDFPNYQNAYSFPFGRQENTVTDKFTGGDKNILSNKDWMDSVMTRLWELGGGENWYSPTEDRNVRMIRAPSPAVFSNGENWETIGFHTHWQGLSIIFENANTSGVYYNQIKDQLVDDTVNFYTLLSPNTCLYVDLDRTQNRTGANALVARKAPIQSLGTPTVPGSRFIIAWCAPDSTVYTRDYPYISNVTILPATTSSVGGVRLNETAATGGTPTVVTIGANNRVHIGQAPYAPTSGVALTVTGNASDAINATGGTNSRGLIAIGGATNGGGVYGSGNGTGIGVQADSLLGHAMYANGGTNSGSDGLQAFSNSNGYGVRGFGWQPGGASVSADGGRAGGFFAGPGSDFSLSFTRTGGIGVHSEGGSGSFTNTGGIGGIGVESFGGNGGQPVSIFGNGGNGGEGVYGRGGGGGSTTGVTGAGRGGDGVKGLGGDAGLQAFTTYQVPGDGVSGTGGTGQYGGSGVFGQGGTSGSAGGAGGIGGNFIGGFNGASTNGGIGVFGTGGTPNGIGVFGQGNAKGAGVTGAGGTNTVANPLNGLGGDFYGGTGSYGGDAIRATALVANRSGIFSQGGAGGAGVWGQGNGAGPAVKAVADSGLAVQAIAGDIQVDAANNYTYATAVTAVIHVPITDFTLGGANTPAVNPASTTPGFYGSSTGGANQTSTRIRLPHGATITDVKVLSYNNDGTSRNVSVSIYHAAYNAAGAPGYTVTQVHTGPAGGQVVAMPVTGGLGTETWKSVAVSGSVAPDDGFTYIYMLIPATSATSGVGMMAFRIVYTYLKETPAR